MNCQSDEPKVSDLTRLGGELNADLTEVLWMSGGGVAPARVLPDGSIKGVRMDVDGTLVTICIRKPTK